MHSVNERDEEEQQRSNFTATFQNNVQQVQLRPTLLLILMVQIPLFSSPPGYHSNRHVCFASERTNGRLFSSELEITEIITQCRTDLKNLQRRSEPALNSVSYVTGCVALQVARFGARPKLYLATRTVTDTLHGRPGRMDTMLFIKN